MIVIPILASGLIIGVLYWSGPDYKAGPDKADATSYEPPNKERLYDFRLVEKNQFLYSGATVKEWKAMHDELFLLDGATEKITVVDYEGKQLRTLGKPGEAPWEQRQTQHLWVDSDGYATIDNAHMVVKKYSHANELLFYGKLESPLWDGVYLGGSKFFILDDEPSDPGFYSVDARTGISGERQSLTSMLTEVSSSDYLNIVYEGQVLRSNSMVTYLCSRTGKFMVFNGEGVFQFTASTIDNTPPPDVRARKSGNITYYVREPDINTNYSGTMDDEFLFVLSLIAWEKTSTLSIDAYHLEDGSYAFSMSVPNEGNDLPIEILREGTDFFILYEGHQIIRYEMVSNQV